MNAGFVLLASGHSHALPTRFAKARLGGFALGALVAGAAFYAMVAGVPRLVALVDPAVVWSGAIALATLGHLVGGTVWSSPLQIRRDIASRGIGGATVYGAVLGVGVWTRTTSWFVWAGLVFLLLSAVPLQGLVYGAAFAAGRCLGLLWLAPRRNRVDPAAMVEACVTRPRRVYRVMAVGAGTALVVLTWI